MVRAKISTPGIQARATSRSVRFALVKPGRRRRRPPRSARQASARHNRAPPRAACVSLEKTVPAVGFVFVHRSQFTCPTRSQRVPVRGSDCSRDRVPNIPASAPASPRSRALPRFGAARGRFVVIQLGEGRVNDQITSPSHFQAKIDVVESATGKTLFIEAADLFENVPPGQKTGTPVTAL